MLGTLFFITWIFYHIFFCFSNFYASFLSVKQYVYRRQNFSSGYFLQIYIFFLGFCKSTLNTKKDFLFSFFILFFCFQNLFPLILAFFLLLLLSLQVFLLNFTKNSPHFPADCFFIIIFYIF